jgi:hypothetical protein
MILKVWEDGKALIELDNPDPNLLSLSPRSRFKKTEKETEQ